jgi:DNA-directed RNA polymerase subunit RPC12/RpoP
MPDVRLIDANALAKDIHSSYSDDLGILEHIDNAPTIKANPVKCGKWKCVNDDEGIWMCSNCGNEIFLEVGSPAEFEWFFCPYCGANMGGGRKE